MFSAYIYSMMVYLIFFMTNFSHGLQERNLSCDLSKIEKLPKIYLVGEDHNDENSKLVKQIMIIDGAQGEYPVASEVDTEGPFYPDQRNEISNKYHRRAGATKPAKLYGIESPVPFAIMGSLAVTEVILNGDSASIQDGAGRNEIICLLRGTDCPAASGKESSTVAQ